MRKELLFAILTGIFFGLIIAFGVWRANNAFKPIVSENKVELAQSQQQKPDNTPQLQNSKLIISSAENDDVITANPFLLTGMSKPNSSVVISAEGGDSLLSADAQGNFQKEIDLVGGVNHLAISSFDESDFYSETSLTLVFSTEFNKKENE